MAKPRGFVLSLNPERGHYLLALSEGESNPSSTLCLGKFHQSAPGLACLSCAQNWPIHDLKQEKEMKPVCQRPLNAGDRDGG